MIQKSNVETETQTRRKDLRCSDRVGASLKFHARATAANRFAKAALFVALGFSSSCTRSAGLSPNLVVALSAPPATLDPRLATDATGSRIAGLLYSSLVRIGPDLKPVGDAAKTWRIETTTTYVFDLKPGLSFSDGHALSAADVDSSFATFLSSKSAYASSFESVESVSSTLIEGHIRTTVKLKTPSATFLSDLASLKLLEKNDPSEPPLGSGPFVLETQTANDIILKSRRDHPYAAPRVPGVDFKIVRDDNTRVLKMLKGELDLAQAEFPPMKITQLEVSDRLKIYKYPGLALTYLLFNFKDPFLAQLKNRQAIAHAIDRNAIVTYKLDGLATLATSLLTPNNPFFDHDLRPLIYSPEQARAHEPSPKLIIKTSSAPAAVDNGRIIANDLAKAGFENELQSHEWGTFYGDVQSGRFQLAILRWVGTIDPDLYRKAFHSLERPPKGRNRGSYSNAEVDRLTEEGRTVTELGKRKQIYFKIQKLIDADLPFVPLWYDTEVAVVNRRVLNYEPAPDGSFWILTKVDLK